MQYTVPALVLLAASAVAQSVTLPAGTLQGGQCSNSNASYFYSVPYAQPPIGDLRFAAPQVYNGKLGQATTRTPNCIQFGNEFAEAGNSSEDCLYLDIWVPSTAKSGDNLPVKVWIYGGGNFAGSISDPTYNGCNLAATGSIVVSINYRLGPLGFLALNSAGIEGNMGTQDQLLGLSWVQSNIKAFGGDPTKVVLFGQSAGAVDTFVLSTLPQASSLFKAGIPMSGGGGALPSYSSSNAFGAKWASSLNCSGTDAACLRSLPVQALNNTLPAATGPSYNVNNVGRFGPTIDGKIIPAQPATVGVQVPSIFSSTTQEGTLLILSIPGVTGPQVITPAIYAAYLSSTFGSAASLVANRYPVSAFNNTPFPAFYAMVQVYTESNFECPAYNGLVTAASKGVPVWTYRWGQAPTCPWYTTIPEDALPVFGAAHTADIPFVFGNVNDNPPPNGTCNFTAAEDSLSREFIGIWTSMAENANPGSSFPAFSTNNTLGLNVNNGTSMATAGVVDFSQCAFWNSIRIAVSGNSSTSSNTTTTGSGSTTSSPAAATYTGGVSSTVAQWPLAIGIAAVIALLM